MDLREMRWSGMGWIDLAQEHGCHKMLGNSRVVAQLAAFREGSCSVELVTKAG
jgi:hypothetical protein